MLYSELFLKKLQSQQIQTKWAKIILLNWNEEPEREIQGQITGGSENIDGNSAIRTTISLNIVSNTDDLTQYQLRLRSKISVEIGLENKIDKEYPDIIWFKQGIFIITSFNTSKTLNQTSLSISGKDKGCLLNGEISGTLPATTDFGRVDEYANTYEPISNFTYRPKTFYYKYISEEQEKDPKTGKMKNKEYFLLDYSQVRRINEQYYEKISSITTTDLPIKDIIRNIVHVYGHEPWHKIIINDLELKGSELLEYRGETPLYLIKKGSVNNNVFIGLTLDGDFEIGGKKIGSLSEEQYLSLAAIDDEVNQQITPLGDDYYIVKIEYGETMGYRGTELTYPGDLIGNVGETVVSILDKIKNILGNFEYFYDPDGNFVFQAKHTYENVSFSKFKTDGDNEIYIDGSFYNNNIIYSFTDEETTTQFSHTPNITNLKNDFSIWGEGTTSNGGKKPIHLRYAIENKPYQYTTIGEGERAGITYATGEEPDPRLYDAFKLLSTTNDEVAKEEEEIQSETETYDSEINKKKTVLSDHVSELVEELKMEIPEDFITNYVFNT